MVEVRIAGQEMVAVAEDVPRLRDGLGIPVPPGVAAAFTEPAAQPDRRPGAALGPHPRTRSSPPPWPGATGSGRAVVEAACQALVGPGTLVAGSFVDLPGDAGQRATAVLPRPGAGADQAPHAGPAAQGGRAGRAGAPTPGSWPSGRALGSPAAGRRRGAVGTLEQLAGLPDAGQRGGVGDPARPGRRLHPGHARRAHRRRRGVLGRRRSDRRVRRLGPLVRRPTRSRTRPRSSRRTTAARSCWPPSAGGGAYFFDALLPSGVGDGRPGRLRRRALGPGLGRAGHRRHLRPGPQPGSAGGAHRRPSRPAARTHRARLAGGGLGRPSPGARIVLTDHGRPLVTGRAAASRRRPARLAADVFAQLDRYGVVTRGSVLTEDSEGGFGAAYRALSCTGGVRPVPARLLRRGSGRRAVRPDRRGRPAAGAAAGARAAAGAGAGGLRPGQPVRCRAALAGAGGPSARPQGRAPWWCWSTARWCSTSSAAARRCCPSPRTRCG